MLKANNHSDTGPGDVPHLRRMAYFAAVVETGSFTAAAERLGITKAVVSQQIARLEREFNTALLIRTTRHVQPTEAGYRFYQRCALILHEAGDAFAELAETASEPSGLLRLTAPLDYGISVVVPALADFTRQYPRCKVDMKLSDQPLDLLSDNIELAIRVGWLTELHLQARQIGTFQQWLVAPAAWRERIAHLTSPAAITALPFIANTALRDPLHWVFSRPGADSCPVTVKADLFFSATFAVREAVRQGAGLSVLPDFAVAEDLARGHVIQVLPDWQLPGGGIHAVFPASRFRPAKVRAFVDLLAEREKTSPTAITPSLPAGDG
ncbi:LysR family transcriptional regulator [Dickeya fangzhongdai]|uniref:LysR family transcriptional regulator n=1 Tax=Dickeya fangzhongdai TaxID=1778540 RepID=UPI002B292E44|nr:LysR family transcriptional regulator [Dickeya fangzhongdai]